MTNPKAHPRSTGQSRSEYVKMVLFMLFIPGIYVIGKLVTQLF